MLQRNKKMMKCQQESIVMSNLLSNIISIENISALAHSENLSFDDEERISILRSMRSIDVQACPGSGKTTLIAAKLILLANKWPLSGQGICVLSHTNVAKNEIIEGLKNLKLIQPNGYFHIHTLLELFKSL